MHSGPQCYCQRGYQLASDGISCEGLLTFTPCTLCLVVHIDFDECSTVGTCQQLCVNTPGDYECRCAEGYFANLETDTCMAEGMHAIVI